MGESKDVCQKQCCCSSEVVTNILAACDHKPCFLLPPTCYQPTSVSRVANRPIYFPEHPVFQRLCPASQLRTVSVYLYSGALCPDPHWCSACPWTPDPCDQPTFKPCYAADRGEFKFGSPFGRTMRANAFSFRGQSP